MLTRTKVCNLTIAALLILTLVPGDLTAAASPEPLGALSDAEAAEAHLSDFSASSAQSAIQSPGAPTTAASPCANRIYTLLPRANAGWEEVGVGSASGGGISSNNGESYSPSLATTSDGTLYIAWNDFSDGDAEIYVKRWNGSDWEEVGIGSANGGGISNSGGWSGQSSVAIAPDDTPYVAWKDDSGGDREIYVRRWNGSIWEEIGAGSATGGGVSNIRREADLNVAASQSSTT